MIPSRLIMLENEEELTPDEVQANLSAYGDVEKYFNSMRRIETGTRITKARILSDGLIIKIGRGKRSGERTAGFRPREWSSPDSETYCVSTHFDKYSSSFVKFNIRPSGLITLELFNFPVMLGNLTIGGCQVHDTWHYEEIYPRERLELRRITPRLVDWLHEIYTQNKRVPLKFTAEL